MLVAAKLDGVKTYMRMRRVPNHLQVKVIKWFDYLWLTQKCSDEEKAVSCLPGEALSLSHSHFKIPDLFRNPQLATCSVPISDKRRVINLPRGREKKDAKRASEKLAVVYAGNRFTQASRFRREKEGKVFTIREKKEKKNKKRARALILSARRSSRRCG